MANRIREIPEVSRMTLEQCQNLIRQGFITELKYNVDEIDLITSHISWVTDRLPQRIHEYCLELAFLGEKNKKIDRSLLNEADRFWLRQSLAMNYSVIESMMNERDTKVGRRNQTLYSLGLVEIEEFKWSDIEEILRREFKESTTDLDVNVRSILSFLSNSTHNPIIKRSPKGDAYCFTDPKYRMCLRTMLRVNKESDVVEKLPISNI